VAWQLFLVLPTLKWVNSENHNFQRANRGLNDKGFKRWSERNVLYFVDISSIGFIINELDKIQLRFKEAVISNFYPQYSRMSLIFKTKKQRGDLKYKGKMKVMRCSQPGLSVCSAGTGSANRQFWIKKASAEG